MKVCCRIPVLLLMVVSIFLIAGCGKKTSPEIDPAEKVQLAKLETSTWRITSVTVDGKNRTDFPNLALTISGTFNGSQKQGPYDYAFTGTRPTPSPWPLSGTWKFGENPAQQLIRLDSGINPSYPDVDLNYSVTDTQLTISFVSSGAGYAGGRTDQVDGAWVFVFGK